MPARSAVAIASKTVAFANTVSGGPRQNFHHGGGGGSCEFSALASLLGAGRGCAAASERLGARSSLFMWSARLILVGVNCPMRLVAKSGRSSMDAPPKVVRKTPRWREMDSISR
jgi:hypothetical protein